MAHAAADADAAIAFTVREITILDCLVTDRGNAPVIPLDSERELPSWALQQSPYRYYYVR